MNIVVVAIMLIGLVAIGGAVFEWGWFINNRRVRIFARVLGRTGARIFYGVVGSLLLIWGALFTLGLLG